MRILFFGMEGVFSRAPLLALLAAGWVSGVVVPRPMGVSPLRLSGDADSPIRQLPPPRRTALDIPLLGPTAEPTVVGLAWDSGVPVYEVATLKHGAVTAALAPLAADAIAVACFPRLLPPALLRLPRLGAFNVHPSLLPAYRGPEPLFWVFHDGLEHAGVTVHAMDAGADTGAIAAQTAISLPDGIGYEAAQRALSDVGARLLVDTLRRAEARTLTLSPQDEGHASHAPVPTTADFVITPDWSAHRAFNFIRGVGGWGPPVVLAVNGEHLRVHAALAYDSKARLPEPLRRVDDTLQVRCSPGVLTLEVD